MITPLSCARTAAVALSHANVPDEQRDITLLELATKLGMWVAEGV
jgi:hypothetical protein